MVCNQYEILFLMHYWTVSCKLCSAQIHGSLDTDLVLHLSSSSLYDKVSGSNAVYHLRRNQPSIPPIFEEQSRFFDKGRQNIGTRAFTRGMRSNLIMLILQLHTN